MLRNCEPMKHRMRPLHVLYVYTKSNVQGYSSLFMSAPEPVNPHFHLDLGQTQMINSVVQLSIGKLQVLGQLMVMVAYLLNRQFYFCKQQHVNVLYTNQQILQNI